MSLRPSLPGAALVRLIVMGVFLVVLALAFWIGRSGARRQARKASPRAPQDAGGGGLLGSPVRVPSRD